MTAIFDPIKALRRRLALTASAGTLAIAAAAMWAFLVPTRVELPQIDVAAVVDGAAADSEQAQASSIVQIDPQVFDVRLWNPPPRPDDVASARAPEPSPPPPPPPLRVIGIINDAGVLRAALYDLEQDKLFIVQHGESVRDCIVERIDPATVVLQQGDRSHELHLKEGQS